MFAEIASIAGPVLGGLIGGESAKKAASAQAAATQSAIDNENNQYIQNRADLAPYRNLGKAATLRLGDLLGLQRSREDFVLPNGMRLGEEVARDYEEQVRKNVLQKGTQAAERPFLERTDSIRNVIMDRYQPAVLAKYGVTPEQLNAPQAGPSPEEIMKMDPGYQFRLGEGQQAIDRRIGAMGLRNSGAALKAGTRYAQDYATGAFDSIYNRLAGAAGTGQTAANTTAGLGAQNAANVGGLMTAGANARGASAIAQGNAIGGAANTIGSYYSQQNMLDKILASGRGGVPGSSVPGYFGTTYGGT